jgi:hypothetical protein
LRIQRILVAVCLPLLLTAGARAQSLVANSGFDRDLNGWLLQQGNAVWTSNDAEGSPLSGSLLATPAGSGNPASLLSACFPATPGSYTLSFKHYLPQASSNTATVFLHWYSDDSCSHLVGNSTSLGSNFPGPPWQTIDTQSIGLDLIAPAGTQSAAVQVLAYAQSYFDDFVVQRKGSCPSDNCLNNNRFAVTVRWTTGNLNGSGREVKLTSDSAYFWFFDPSNVELVVKVLDGCALNNNYWVFMGGLTNVKVDITITDLATGATRTYTNKEGQAFQPIQDTSAFATCP